MTGKSLGNYIIKTLNKNKQQTVIIYTNIETASIARRIVSEHYNTDFVSVRVWHKEDKYITDNCNIMVIKSPTTQARGYRCDKLYIDEKLYNNQSYQSYIQHYIIPMLRSGTYEVK